MKKLFGISLIAIMSVTPLIAGAAEGDRAAGLTKLNASDPVATANLATTSYVGGAYKATADKIDLLIDDTAVSANGNYILAGKSVAANLGELDAAIKGNSDTISELVGDGENSIDAKIEAALEDYDGTSTTVGDLDDLNTTDKTSVVDAINEVDSTIGDLDDLSTTNQTSVVGAINEVDSAVSDLENKTITYVESWATPTPITQKLSQLPDFGS